MRLANTIARSGSTHPRQNRLTIAATERRGVDAKRQRPFVSVEFTRDRLLDRTCDRQPLVSPPFDGVGLSPAPVVGSSTFSHIERDEAAFVFQADSVRVGSDLNRMKE